MRIQATNKHFEATVWVCATEIACDGRSVLVRPFVILLVFKYLKHTNTLLQHKQRSLHWKLSIVA